MAEDWEPLRVRGPVEPVWASRKGWTDWVITVACRSGGTTSRMEALPSVIGVTIAATVVVPLASAKASVRDNFMRHSCCCC